MEVRSQEPWAQAAFGFNGCAFGGRTCTLFPAVHSVRPGVQRQLVRGTDRRTSFGPLPQAGSRDLDLLPSRAPAPE